MGQEAGGGLSFGMAQDTSRTLGPLTPGLPGRLLGWSQHATEFLGGVLVAISLVSVTIQIVMRYGFNNANTWSDTLASASLAWIAFLAATAAVRSERNLSVRFVVSRLPQTWQRLVQTVIHLAILGFAVVLTWSGRELMELTMDSNVEGFLVPASWGQIYAVSVISGVLMTLYTIEHLVAIWRGRR